MKTPKPVILCILDGWGHRDELADNAIAAAKTPTWDYLLQTYPHGLINASELEVGLPKGQMGNSEVGHMNIGAGRVVMQDLPRIDTAIVDGSLANNPNLAAFIATMKQSGGTAHVMGLVSDGGVHSHQTHIAALVRLLDAAGVKVVVHAFLDGRDTPPKSAEGFMATLTKEMAGTKATIATVSGRYYAMDRDKRWERVQLAYDVLAHGKGETAANASSAIANAYAANITDEFVKPCVIGAYAGMKAGDGVVMANFRADRAREILTVLLDEKFDGFARTNHPKCAAALGMVEYSSALNPLVASLFPPVSLTNILPEVVANAGLTQLRIAETEKYAHVTFFLSGGREEHFAGESRILIPSPKVATYDLQPEMSAPEVTDKLVEAIEAQAFDVIIVNYANTDMVGHSGDLVAATKAVEAVDTCLGRVVKAVEKVGGAMVISADHGNAEMMMDHDTHQPHTAHTLNLVPVVIVSAPFKNQAFPIREGRLADLAPTVLQLMNLPKPKEMTGETLIPEQAHARATA